MKKSLKRLSAILIAAVLILTTVTSAFAVTIYYYFGYSYTYINSDLVSLYGVEEGTDYLFIPDTLNNKKLVDIRNYAFMNNSEIAHVDFAGATNLERIGSFAFANCANITDGFTIPSTVNTIGNAAFEKCTSLGSVVYNASVSYVPNQCFNGCASLSSVTLTDGIEKIGSYAFANCSKLEYIEIPSTVTEIAATAFQNDSITLGVYNNSTAHTYAQDNGIQFVVLDAPVPTPTEPVTEAPTEPETLAPSEPVTEQLGYILGDADGNGDIESIDVTQIQRYLALMVVLIPESTLMHGDVDGNGELTPVDVTYIQRFMNEMTTPYPIGEFLGQ